MNPIKKLAGQTALYGLSSIVPRFLNYLLTPYYTRKFFAADYGIITELYTYLIFIQVILTYGMETGFFRFSKTKENKEEVYSTIYYSILTTTILFCVSCILLSGDIADLLNYGSHPEYITWFSLIIGLDIISSIPFARLREENRALKFSMVKIFEVVVNIVFNIIFLTVLPAIFAKNPHGWVTYIYNPNIGIGYVFIANLIASASKQLFLINETFKVRTIFNWSLYKELLFYSLPLMISNLAGTINEGLDRLLLKHILPKNVNGSEQLGIYGANVKIAVVMTIFTQMYRYAAEPFFFSMEKKEDSKQIYADVMKYFIIFGLIIFLNVQLYIDAYKLFIGSSYRSGLVIVPILQASYIMFGIFYNLSFWYKFTGKTYYGAIFTFVGAFVTIMGNVLFVPDYGFIAAAWTKIACYLVMIVPAYYLGQKNYKINYDLKTISKYLLIASIIYVASLFNNLPFILKISVNTALFISFVYYIIYTEKIKLNLLGRLKNLRI